MNCNGQRNNQNQEGLHSTHWADSTRISVNKNWTILLLVGRASSILQDSVKCVLHIRREMKLDTFVNYAFHFTKGLISRNATQLGTARLYMHFLQYWVQEHHLLCSRTVNKNTMTGWTFEGYKISGDCGYLIKGPTGRQCVNCVTFQKHRQDQEPERQRDIKVKKSVTHPYGVLFSTCRSQHGCGMPSQHFRAMV